MWKKIRHFAEEAKHLGSCEQCGARWPSFKDAGMSIQSFRWSCSPECYSEFIDGLVESASPDAHYDCGAVCPELVDNREHSLRWQMHAALEKFQGEFNPSGL